jgi:hypothetical protein
MIQFLREAFKRLLIPASIGFLWVYADLSRQADGYVKVRWQEGPVFRTGNPYTAPVDRVFIDDPEPPEDTVDAVADINSVEDAQP